MSSSPASRRSRDGRGRRSNGSGDGKACAQWRSTPADQGARLRSRSLLCQPVNAALHPLFTHQNRGESQEAPMRQLTVFFACLVLGSLSGCVAYKQPSEQEKHNVSEMTTHMRTWALGRGLRDRYQRLQVEHQHEAAVQADPCLPYIEAQERALDRSLGNLLNNMERRRSLYQLPWYLVLGEENAGKTSLITRSNQSFALSHVTRAGVRAHQDEQLAYPVDWWMGDEAVLIDPPGEFLSQPESPAENVEQQGKVKPLLPAGTHPRLWLHLLDWLARNRSRRALNGVVLVIDVQALLGQRPEQRKAHANLLRTRLFELTRQLGTRLPVYVTLSKFDLLEGFEEFFARLTLRGREDLLGFTFSLDAVDDFDAWLTELTRQYQAFVACLSEQVFDGVKASRGQDERDRLQGLLRQ